MRPSGSQWALAGFRKTLDETKTLETRPEGAPEGAGLGDRFLGHVERCRVLLHLIDSICEHAGKAYKTVRNELVAYGHGLAEKREIVALNKAVALTPEAWDRPDGTAAQDRR